MSSNRDDRFDMLDLLINLLKEHEKKMSDLSYRLEAVIADKSAPIRPIDTNPEWVTGISVTIALWEEFKKQCTGARLLALDITDKIFRVTAINGNILFFYEEMIPILEIIKKTNNREELQNKYSIADTSNTIKAFTGTLDCGLELERTSIDSSLSEKEKISRLIYYVDTQKAKLWLADQLNVKDSSIIIGTISTNK